ncbi:MAG TPA: PSD1 and planctomycete cytochrome C domain-containing protein, partial [Chthoniobacteraceae bacterium]|nr:PSD1 and planctomycete cytochrome C domain-containing protein [Chthoniobacteraceae bacterium]
DLRLDRREGALADLGGYAAIVPGHPEKSALIERVSSHDKDELMPPPKSKKPPLTSEQIATLSRWIEEGAEYQAHWAFIPLDESAPPEVKDAAWIRNPIDAFVLERLEREGLHPSAEADRATLLRRVALDLTGLIPTPEEASAFLNDKTADAYERLVDRLLASPHYGERWGRHWLDQARYADSNGYSIDSARAMWPYRDWVIKALNDDMPFDRFTIEQLAGDLLPNHHKSQLIASAFHRNTLINEEGGTKPEQFRVEAAIDRVNTTAAVWLGLTVGCAQCHTHKFDPISHREFYELFAFFNQGEDVNNRGATIDVARGEVFGTGAPAEVRRQQADVERSKLQPAWEKQELARFESAPAGKVEWQPVKYNEYDTATGAGFQLLDDNSLLSDGRGAFNDTYRVVARTDLKKIAAIRLRVLTHHTLPRQGPGRASNGNFVLTEVRASVAGQDRPIVRAFADHEQSGYPAMAAVDNQSKTGWAINAGRNPNAKLNADHEIVFVFEKAVALKDGTFELRLQHDLNQNYLIGRFAIDVAEHAPLAPISETDAFFTALKTPAAERAPEQQTLLRNAFQRANATPPGGQAAKGRDAAGDIAELMVMRDLEKPRPTFIHLRGDFLRPDEKTGPVQPGVIAAVQSAFHKPAPEFHNRLDLAKWLVDPENPLTPRVTMNRMWMRYFGRGIVETDEDFGTQGTPPTHPALLDWLGREFIRRGWSQKAMHRLIVTSATYRQASLFRADIAEKDPRNLLLARQERLRVEAEIIRDAALSASGLLDRTIGGPSVFPPQPQGVYEFTQTAKKWTTSSGHERYRRGLYTMFFRSAPYPLFTTFDSPDFQTVCTRRTRSNTPLQALAVANDEAFFEIAQGLAARIVHDVPRSAADPVDERIRYAFQLCLCRAPTAQELTILK